MQPQKYVAKKLSKEAYQKQTEEMIAKVSVNLRQVVEKRLGLYMHGGDRSPSHESYNIGELQHMYNNCEAFNFDRFAKMCICDAIDEIFEFSRSGDEEPDNTPPAPAPAPMPMPENQNEAERRAPNTIRGNKLR